MLFKFPVKINYKSYFMDPAAPATFPISVEQNSSVVTFSPLTVYYDKIPDYYHLKFYKPTLKRFPFAYLNGIPKKFLYTTQNSESYLQTIYKMVRRPTHLIKFIDLDKVLETMYFPM